MTEITIKKDRIVCDFPYDQEKKDILKLYLGASWNKRTKTWSVKNNYVNRQALDGIFPNWRTPEQNNRQFFEIPSYLMSHQKKALKTAYKWPRWGFFYDCGTGKTLIGIEIHKMIGGKTLVVCLRSLIENAWIEDIKRFAPKLRYLNAHKMRKRKRFEEYIEPAEIVIINYESFKNDIKIYERFSWDTLLIDESSKLKSHTTKTTKQVSEFSYNVPNCYLFSGTPAPNHPMEYYNQMRVLNPFLFDCSQYRFRNKFFIPLDRQGFKYELNPELKDDFYKKISSVSEVVRKSDVLDLPEKTFVFRDVELSKKEAKAYHEMIQQLVVYVENSEVSTANQLTKIMKLRQITSGSIIDSKNDVIHKLGNSKANALIDILEEIGNNQIVIWVQFHFEVFEISNIIKKTIKEKPAICTGKQSATQQDNAISQFKSGQARILIAHPGTIAHGQTLVNCHNAIYYSLSYSYEQLTQSIDRFHRKGQTHPCTYYILNATISKQKTIDKIIWDVLQCKGNIENEVFSYIQNTA